MIDIVLVVTAKDRDLGIQVIDLWQGLGHSVLVLDDGRAPSGLSGSLGRMEANWNHAIFDADSWRERVRALKSTSSADGVMLVETDFLPLRPVDPGRFKTLQEDGFSSFAYCFSREDVDELPDSYDFSTIKGREWFKPFMLLPLPMLLEGSEWRRLDYMLDNPKPNLSDEFIYIGEDDLMQWIPGGWRRQILADVAEGIREEVLNGVPFKMPRPFKKIPVWSR